MRYCLITKNVVQGSEPALYFSRGQRQLYLQAIEDEDGPPAAIMEEDETEGREEEEEGMRASG